MQDMNCGEVDLIKYGKTKLHWIPEAEEFSLYQGLFLIICLI